MRVVFLGTPEFAVPSLDALAAEPRSTRRLHATRPAEGPREPARGIAR